MHPAPSQCPFCGGEIIITRVHCQDCDTTLEGRFTSSGFAHLSREQLKFIETFIRCEGKIKHMETELGLSYPTIRKNLHEVIRALGYEPGKEEVDGLSEEERLQILAELEAGTITYEEAMSRLQEKEG